METLDELKHVFAKYQFVVVEGRPMQQLQTALQPKVPGAAASLLDLGTPSGNDPTTAVLNDLADLGTYRITNYFCIHAVD